MAIQFKLIQSRRMAYFGVRADEGEWDGLGSALTPFAGLSIIDVLRRRVAGRPTQLEIFWAGNLGFPDDVHRYGIARLRSRLIAAGFEDRSSAGAA